MIPARLAVAMLRGIVVTICATACASALAQAPLPQPQMQGAVTYLNGGAGDEEIGFIKQSMKDYDLALSFSRSGGEYVASVAVLVKDMRGATVIDLPSVGPYLLLKLPTGKYSVVANYHGDSKTRPVTVKGNASPVVSFSWQ